MIKFFRKIRKQLLTQNKFTKYLLYAIGEIVLVVIGILIALQINNANENRKYTERTKQLLINVQKELLINIKYANNIIDFYRGKDSIMYKVLNKKATYNDYKNNQEYIYLVSITKECPIVDGAFKNFIESHNELSNEQDSIVIKLKELYGEDKKNVNKNEILAEKVAIDFLEELRREKEWFYKYISFNEFTDEMIDYFLNDPSYLNNVSNYDLVAFDNYFSSTLYFRNRAIMIYEKISESLNLKKDNLIAKNFKGYEHYIGTYKTDSLYTIKIKEEKNELIIYQLKQQDETLLVKTRVFPDSKTYFTFWEVFGRLKYDKNNKVNGLVLYKGNLRMEFKKVK